MLPHPDQFRNDFFARFVEIEKEKERDLKRKQRNCFHSFTVVNGNIQCSKCELYKKQKCDKLLPIN